MTSVRHEPVFEALRSLEDLLIAGDALGAEAATEHVLQLLAVTTQPAADPRLRPLFARCQERADALKASLQLQLRESATSHRAAQAYVREVGERP